MLAEVGELDVDEASGGRRDEHLPAVTGCRDTGGPMHVVTYVAFLSQQRRPGVQPAADPDRPCSKPVGHGRRRSHSTRCGREGEEERIALRIDLDATLASACLANDPPVFGERGGVKLGTEFVQEHR